MKRRAITAKERDALLAELQAVAARFRVSMWTISALSRANGKSA